VGSVLLAGYLSLLIFEVAMAIFPSANFPGEVSQGQAIFISWTLCERWLEIVACSLLANF
jgi:hypothetical protein